METNIPTNLPLNRSNGLKTVFVLVLIVGLSILVVVGWGLYITKSASTVPTQSSSSSSNSVSSAQVAFTPTIPVSYNVLENRTCGINIPIPANRVVTNAVGMDIGRQWVFDDRLPSGMLLDYPLTNTLSVDYQVMPFSQGLANDYVAGYLSIQCGPNSQGLTADSLLSKLNSIYIAQHAADPNITLFTADKKESRTMWGQNVVVYDLSGGNGGAQPDHYLVATKDYVYDIQIDVMSTNQSIVNAVNVMLNNLEFVTK